MGYFPNGTSGMMYEERYCSKCAHEDEESGCVIMLAHLIYNYDECNNEKSILHLLIPRDERGDNKQCTMFVPKQLLPKLPGEPT